MSRSRGTPQKGIGFWGALQLILIVLKLLNLIDWSWMLVLFPLWIDIAIVVVIVLWWKS